MKSTLIVIFTVICFFGGMLTMGGVRRQADFKQVYKMALDAGTDAAAKHTTYTSGKNLDELSSGFGEGLADGNNIPLDKEESLEWFYKIFFRNLNVENNMEIQTKLRYYIPMKAVVTFHHISIADLNDNWIMEKDFVINYRGQDYLFTLSNQVQNVSTGIWTTDTALGLSKEQRQGLVANFITEEIESFLNNRQNNESDYRYQFHIGLSDMDLKLKTVGGSNMIVLSEGIPIPSLNWFSPKQKLYAFSIGGSEIIRIK